MPALTAAEEPPLKVVILAGQSNAVGKRALIEELPPRLRGEQSGALFFEGSEWVPLAAGRTEPLGFGPEISLAPALSERLERPIGIIKHSSGGVNLAEDWSPGATGSLFHGLVEKVLAARTVRPIELVAAVWLQGEADARTEERAAAYGDNLVEFVQALRAAVGRPDLPFIAGRINPPQGPRFPYVDVVRRAQESVALDRYVVIDCDDLPKIWDQVHYSTSGLVTLGERIAEAIERELGSY